jgi:hypothetical protein
MDIEILNWLGPPWEGEEGRVKRTGRGEPIKFTVYICMETTQGISLCSYLYLKLAKMLFSCSYVLSFLFYKIEKKDSRIVSPHGVMEGLALVGGER